MKKLLSFQILFLMLVVGVSGCGVDDSGSETKDLSDFKTDFKCDDSPIVYRTMIKNGYYKDAIKYVCKKYNLRCSGKNIYPKASMNTGYAYTSAVTDGITLGKKAFSYPKCSVPHDGWLAAVLSHEIYHTYQSKWERYTASMSSNFGAKAANAKLEIAAWGHMWRNRDRFKLSAMMRIEIDSQLTEYRKDL